MIGHCVHELVWTCWEITWGGAIVLVNEGIGGLVGQLVWVLLWGYLGEFVFKRAGGIVA